MDRKQTGRLVALCGFPRKTFVISFRIALFLCWLQGIREALSFFSSKAPLFALPGKATTLWTCSFDCSVEVIAPFCWHRAARALVIGTQGSPEYDLARFSFGIATGISKEVFLIQS